MKGDLTLAILTSNDESLIYSHLVKSTAKELHTSQIDDPENPTPLDVYSALFRIAGNACDDWMDRAMDILSSKMSRKRFLTVVLEAYALKRGGQW